MPGNDWGHMPMTTITIYEVNLEVDASKRDEFAGWLPGHVQRVLAKPGFLGAVIEIEERPADQPPVFCVRYRLQNREALQTYFEKHAAAMRQEGIDRFGEHFRATRRILAATDEV